METTETIKALSWKQPFAALMLPPMNKIETRTRRTAYRGLVLICTSKLSYPVDVIQEISGDKQYSRIAALANELDRRNLLLDGHAIAVGRLVDCRPMKREDEDRCFVAFHPSLWCHVYESVRQIKPFPWKGTQGWTTVPSNIVEQIEFVKACRECGCTDDDCRQCIKKTGQPCYWVESDLCSACVPKRKGVLIKQP